MSLGSLFSDENEGKAKKKLVDAYNTGYEESTGQLKKGAKALKKEYKKGLGEVGNARDASLAEFDPYVAASAPAAGLYADALGLNGADGNTRAVDAFQTGPGYQFAVDQGLQAIERARAAGGMLASGNTLIDAGQFVTGAADQEYGSWLDRLYGQQQFGAGIAGQRAGLRTNAGTQRAAIRTGLGDVKLGVREKLGDLGYATALGKAGVRADYQLGKDATGSNILGAATGAASLGSKLLGL